jgi:hypothetical protein
LKKLEKIFITYEDKILDLYSPYTNRAIQVANRLFTANKNLPEVSAITWKLTVIDNPSLANAVAFPVTVFFIYFSLFRHKNKQNF